jgi:hypothetical protein
VRRRQPDVHDGDVGSLIADGREQLVRGTGQDGDLETSFDK